ncbi:hypothetical protein [Aeromonas salmonicida]|uniref:hypothetical protein n=1 Tax=Aeromonas salmonicida TaxID=645 RepID=UPI00240D3545|nr:hypothetical protein [Aeromonas salmonicida]MDM5149249.1 hypothetical protein [Aeromonas salmonicida]WFC12863.1 hypothetical protein L3V47_14070 [Aeromonas salmonicida]
MDELLEVRFFKDGIDDFLDLLRRNEIPYEKIDLFPPGTIVASGEVLEILKALAGLSLAPSIAAVILQWLKSRSARKVILQTKDNKIFHLEGYAASEIEKLIKNTKNITIIQTEHD